MAAHDRRRRPGVHRWKRMAGRGRRRRGRNGGDEPVATAMPRLDEARTPGIIVEGPPQLLDARRERRVTDDRISPHGAEQLRARDQLAGALDQGSEHGRRPRRDFHLALAGPETTALRMEAVATEDNLLFHQPFPGAPCRRPLPRRISPFSWDFAGRGFLPSRQLDDTRRHGKENSMTSARRTMIAAFAVICLSAHAALAQPAVGVAGSGTLAVKGLAEKKVAQLPPGPLFWRVENFPTRAEAQSAAGPLGLVAESNGKIWLLDRKSTRLNSSHLGI